MRYLVMASLLIAALVLLPVNISAQVCDSLSLEVTAEISTDPNYEGLYKYTISGYWEATGPEEGGTLSFIMFSLGAECPCLCDSSYSEIYFPNPAGTATGINDHTEAPCEAQLTGFLQCGGMEDITTDDAVKYEVNGESCVLKQYGTGEWIFYSTMEPLPWAEYCNAVFLKYGEMLCTGDLSGQLPDCFECSEVSTEEDSWGSIKSLYH